MVLLIVICQQQETSFDYVSIYIMVPHLKKPEHSFRGVDDNDDNSDDYRDSETDSETFLMKT